MVSVLFPVACLYFLFFFFFSQLDMYQMFVNSRLWVHTGVDVRKQAPNCRGEMCAFTCCALRGLHLG